MHKDKITNIYNQFIEDYGFLIKPFICFLIIYTLAIFPIIRANFNYIDDLGRVANGAAGWGSVYGRYLSDFLASFVHAGRYLTDISPLPQMIAVICLSLASTIIVYIFSSSKKISIFSMLAVIPLGLSPYFLECLSYKYDAPYMALSVLVSIVPILFIFKKKILLFITTILCTIIMCTTYQASSGIFPLLVLFYLFYQWNTSKELSTKKIINSGVVAAIGYLTGLLLFKIFCVKEVVGRVSTKIIPLNHFISGFFKNLSQYYHYVLTDFREIWLLLIALLLISFVILAIYNSKRNKMLSSIVTILLLVISSLIMFGVYPALTIPLYDPRAMYGLGICLALLAIIVVKSDKIYIFTLIAIALSWSFFTFAFTYGNALAEQKRYTDFRIQLVINDLNDLEIMNKDNIKKLKIDGSINKSPIIENMLPHYSILNRLVPQTFGSGWHWSGSYFYGYFKLQNIEWSTDDFPPLPILKDTMYHTIYGDDNTIVVSLK